MRNYMVIAVVLGLALMLAACGSAKTPTEPTAPTPPVAPAEPTAPVAPEDTVVVDDNTVTPEAVEGDANVLENTGDILGGGEMQDLGSKVTGVACDLEANKITFTLKNIGLATWQLDQDVPFPAPKDLKPVKIFINGYEANRGSPQYHPDTKERMFGPNELFSENCGGEAELAVGESVECTLYPVKLNRGTGSNDLKAVNGIFIDSPSIDDYIEFTC